MTTFAQRLRELKKAKGVSFFDIAEDIGIGESTVNGYANDKREPKLSYLIWLADYFGVSLDYLAGRDGP